MNEEEIDNDIEEPLLAKGTNGNIVAKSDPPPVSFLSLFKFADFTDFLLITFGTIASIGLGVVMPLFSLVFGGILDAFHAPNPSSKVDQYSLYFLYLALSSFFLNVSMSCFFSISSERQIRRMREKYLSSALRQEIGWFDTSQPGELATRIKGDTLVVQQGIGIKLARLIQSFSQFIAGFTIGFWRGWELSLVMLSILPFLALAATLLMRTAVKAAARTQKKSAEAGSLAEEAISNIRTVVAFNGEKIQHDKYVNRLREAEKSAISAGIKAGIMLGIMLSIIFCAYALGMSYGARQVASDLRHGCVGDGCTTGGDIMTVFWSVLQGAMAIGQCGPNISAVAEARGAAGHLNQVSDRKPVIDSASTDGQKPSFATGRLEFCNISFRYPSRPEKVVLENFNLTIEAGSTVALVGSSGSGKSTVVGLIERFYDPETGRVLFDGKDIKELNVQWVRQQIGLVSQEPILFASSIADNIRSGRENASMEEVIDAAKMANAHDFIVSFPDGYDTLVGEKGVQLSGGQKQRVAIARAIIKDPSILLLDEATSALDSESERVVQEALDTLVRLRRRTTLIIAHRLSTIRNADSIVVLENGSLVEEGTHESLMSNPEGKYHALVLLQTGDEEEDEGGDITPQSPARALHSNNNSMGLSPPENLLQSHSHASIKNFSFSGAINGKGAVEGTETLSKVPKWRLWSLSFPERNYFAGALVASTFSGAVFPVFALILSTVISFFYLTDPDELQRKANNWSLLFLGVAATVGICTFVQTYSYTVMGERLITRLRDQTLEAIIRQDMAFFDKEENAVGALTARLATEATLIKAIAGQNLGSIYQNMITVAVGFLVAFTWGDPRLSAILAAVLPILVLASTWQMKIIRESTTRSQEAVAIAGALAVQAIEGIRTVTAFNMAARVTRMYHSILDDSLKQGVKRGVVDGGILGLGQFVMLATYGFVFWYGGHQVIGGDIAFERMLRSLMAIMMAAQGIGFSSPFLGEGAAANAAASRIFAIIDRRPAIDSSAEGGAKPSISVGKLELRGLTFRYPARPETVVLNQLSLEIEAGSTVALVGGSGSGKSTVVGLIERFYDPERGDILLDGRDIRELNVQWLRQQIGLVSQEPILFASSIADNIKYGKGDASMEEVISAAKMANAHDFIESFPDGYDTLVGEKGAQLSGGQKQRVAIARAIIKDPSILLLDEATSALDSSSERVVQEALDTLLTLKRRTTLVIAHRLSTIRNADMICVMHHGRVVERGTHEQLLKIDDGHYRNLANQMQRSK